MVFLLLDGGMSLITPKLGLIFWTTFIFLLLWIILGKYAFRPISDALKKRENSIQEALDAAEQAKAEMAALKSDNEKIIQEARDERAGILKEAKDTAQSIVNDAKDKAKTEVQKVRDDAMAEIQGQKRSAILEVKNLIGGETVDLAEKILRRELRDKSEQTAFIEQEVNKIKLN